MKKILVLFAVLATSLCIFLASCDDPETASTIADGIGAGADGWSFIDYASSTSECIKMVDNAGYSAYRFNMDLGTCYGR